jgi:NAD+ kinase
MKDIIVVINTSKPNAEKCFDQLKPLMEKHGTIQAVDRDRNLDLAQAKADVLIVLGGDGTFLSVARRLQGNAIPVFGINHGHLGFLSQTSPDEAEAELAKLFKGKYTVVERMMLSAKIAGDGGETASYTGLNDIVISNKDRSRFLYVDAYVGDQFVTRYRGDGIVVSTPTGSTGHSLSAGGPILERGMRAFIMTPICAHTLTIRPLVVSADNLVQLKIMPESGVSAMVVDGEPQGTFETAYTVDIRCLDQPFRMLQTHQKSEFNILNEKMGWGGSL